ncbi:MAG TPA: protein kinase [Kofleriaceae bacterium]
MVFLATDVRLRREVAIKFVRGNDAEHVRRLISEARNQAKVTHERICKVYDVDEVDGKVYIAMQYIAGEQLGQLAGELTLEQKVMLVRGAAEGIHEAHREGIIHRDIKPSNIMVERTDDGEIRPYVMDFGLARSAQEAGTTQSGTLLGTPRYMAPEQAHGAAAKLDRRADVYSLGATLYHLITGQPPIAGDTVAEVIHNLVATEPRAPRAIDPSIPIDLEAILVKCLEKDRSARYDSARALADDLGRFMNGDPVLARPAGAWYRTRKRIAKHRRLVIAGAVALVLVLVAVGWGIKTRVQAAERERLARRFTEKVERIDAMARYSALSPRHDLRGDRVAIRARMDEIRQDIDRAGAAAAGPGHYALGRGYLALDDDAQAQRELEIAWQSDFDEPQVAYALALALGHLYRQNLLAAERIKDKDPREARKRVIEKQYREPALGYLRKSHGAEVPSQAYVAALVAYYEGRFDEALQQLDKLGGGLSWFYEAPELRGDILLARALASRHQGKSDPARRDFEAGRTAYAAAAAIGESVPAVYTSLGDLEYEAMAMELYGHGDAMPPCDRALAATANALATDPDHYEALVLEARIRRRLAEHQAGLGLDVEELLGKALEDARRAVIVSPVRPQAQQETTEIYWQWGNFRNARNQDPREQLRKALATSNGIPLKDRDAPYHHDRGLVFSVWADYQERVGVDAQVNRGESIAAYTRALQLDDRMHEAWINLGSELFRRALQPRATDPDGDLQRAIAALDRARTINREHYVPYFYEGKIYHRLAQRKQSRGIDPDPDLRRACEAYRGGLRIKSENPHLHNGLGLVLLDRAKLAWDQGEKPEPLLDEALAAFAQAIDHAPEQQYGYGNVGEALVQRAAYQLARGQDPRPDIGAAVDALNQAIERNPDEPAFLADLAMANTLAAAYDLDHERDPEPSLERASSVSRTAVEKHPNDAQSQHYLAETRALTARLHARLGHGKADEFTAAAEAFGKAIALDPENQDTQIAFGQFYRAWAVVQRDMGGQPGPLLTQGLALAAQVLDRRPSWPDALVLRASLTLVQAEILPEAAQRRERATRAGEDFARARAINPALGHAWAGHAARAERLAAAP